MLTRPTVSLASICLAGPHPQEEAYEVTRNSSDSRHKAWQHPLCQIIRHKHHTDFNNMTNLPTTIPMKMQGSLKK